MTAPTRTRPRDRAEAVLKAAIRLFHERGYHSVGIDDIGDAVGITGPAIYKHFPNKEALLTAAATRSVERISGALDKVFADDGPPEAMIAALISESYRQIVADRELAAVYVHESRHLPELPAHLRTTQNAVREMWVESILKLRPDFDVGQARFVLQGVNGLLTSVVRYSPVLPRPRVASLLSTMGVDALLAASAATLPGALSSDDQFEWDPAPSPPHSIPRVSRREGIVSAAIEHFSVHGFGGVGIDDIGLAAGITGPGVYRHFRNKDEILVASLNRANQLLGAAVNNALMANSVHEALDDLISAYAQIVVRNTSLIAVYRDELRSLSPESREAVTRDRDAFFDEWVGLFRRCKPELDNPTARTMVATVAGLLNGYTLGRIKPSHTYSVALLREMALGALLGNPG